MKNKLMGAWRQANHFAIVNDMPCDVIPAENVLWTFADDLLIQSASGIVLAVHRVSFYPDADVIILHPGFSEYGTLFSVRFTADGVALTANNRNKDRILLVRNEELGMRSAS